MLTFLVTAWTECMNLLQSNSSTVQFYLQGLMLKPGTTKSVQDYIHALCFSLLLFKCCWSFDFNLRLEHVFVLRTM